MKVGVVILSRYNSSRLPGKALKTIEGKKVLEYIIERLAQVLDPSMIVLATSDLPSDNPIAQFATENNIQCFRGSLENVAERFFFAAMSKQWDYAIRINGDNIFVDLPLLRQVIDIAKSGTYDFVSNVKDRTFPKGMSVEAVKLSCYKKHLNEINLSSEFKEHVTLFFYQTALTNNHFIYNTLMPEAAGIQMALDTSEDFDRTQNIIKQFSKPHWEYNLKEIIQIWNTL